MDIKITKGKYPVLFGGLGFHNNEACLYNVMEEEHFNQVICKNYREISPGFMRTFAGYSDWTKEAMDDFAEYYNKMQKWTDTPMYLASAKGKIHFSDEEMQQYCNDVAKNLKYLIEEKDVKHIRYYCFSNELTQGTYGWLENDMPLFKKYHEMLYRAFQNYGIDVGLLAPDSSEIVNWKYIDWLMENGADRITEAYCVHLYERKYDLRDTSFYQFFYDICKEYGEKAIRNDGKRLILGEIGINSDAPQLSYQSGVTIDTCRYYDTDEEAYCALKLTEMAFAGINAGVFAEAFWSYTDYPDPYNCAYAQSGYGKEWCKAEKFVSATVSYKYNKWGLMRWEDDGDYSARDLYWCLGYLVKLFKRNSKVLTIENPDDMLRICAIMNKDFSVSIGIVNRNTTPTKITLNADGLLKKAARVYEYDPNNVPRNDFCDLQPYSYLVNDGDEMELKPESVTFITTDYIDRDYAVYASGIKAENGRLSWNAITDDTHCYYRVFADKNPGFEPACENQIASTIAESLPIADESLCYKVLSVDKSGNCYGKA